MDAFSDVHTGIFAVLSIVQTAIVIFFTKKLFETKENVANNFKLLEKVAAFFEKTEPHSPVSYALRKAVRWGKMPLDKWLKEMLNEDSRSEMFKMIGIESGSSDSDSDSEYDD